MSNEVSRESAVAAHQPRRLAFAAVGALVVALPFLIYLVTLPRFGTLARKDYFGDLVTVRDGDHFTHDAARWLAARSNEHRITLPLLVWRANVALTHGDNRAISAFSLALLVVTFWCLLGWLPADLRGSPLWFWPAAAVSAALVATPMAAHNWVLGFSGTQWFLANLSAVAALGLAISARPEDGTGRVALATLAGMSGAFAHSTHLALWPALALGLALVPGPRRRWLWVGAGAAGVYALYALTYRIPIGHPHPSADPLAVVHFALLYLGALASENQRACLALGVAGVVAGALAFRLTVRESDPDRRRSRVLFLALAVYAFANAVGSAVARVGFGFAMALSSRYASLPALFWIGVLGVLAVAAWQRSTPGRRPAAAAAVAALALLVVVPMTDAGFARLRLQLARAAAEPLAELALRWGVWDAAALGIVGAGRSPGVRAGVAFQRALGHVPFDRPDPWPRRSRLPNGFAPGAPYEGVRLEGAQASSDRAFLALRAARRARAPEAEEPSRIVITSDGAVRGVLVPTHLPNEPLPLLSRATSAPLWRGFLERSAAAEPLAAWAVFGATLRPVAVAPRFEQDLRRLAAEPAGVSDAADTDESPDGAGAPDAPEPR